MIFEIDQDILELFNYDSPDDIIEDIEELEKEFNK